MSEQTLEMQIHTKSQQAVQSLNKLVNGLNKVENKINGVNKSVNKVSTSKANKEMNNLNNSINKASNSMLKLKGLFTFSGVKKLTQTGLSWMNEAIDYTEQLNLFNVVFKNIEKNGTTMYSSLGKEATKFQYRMNEAFGTNKTQTLYMQGIFQSMGENVGIGSKYAGIMSESMTKLTYDLASLYNKNEKDTAEAIRAGVYAGQTKPLRSYGIDVTQTSLQPILDSLGIADRSIKQMSQAEKEILRYIATMNQAKVAMGDLANTIESPSNQLKVFRQQLTEAKVSLSSLFIGGLASVLPYVNAFLMVVKEVAKAIASMFGIKLKDYNTSIADSGDAYIDLSDDIDGATDSVKELKRQTLGFDEIHNINEDTGSGNSGGSVSGGIDQRLLDSINGYDNGMSNIKMKASQIRDDIMKWLGFTKEIDPITGEINYNYEGIKTTLKNMWNSFKGLSAEGKILVGLGLVTGAIKLWNAGKNLVSLFGSSGLFKIISNLAKPFKNLIEYTRVYTSITGNLKDGIVGGIDAWRKQNGIIAETTGKFTGWTSVVNGGKIALKGLITAGLGLYTVSEATKNLSTEGANLVNVLGLVVGSLTTIASGVQIGAIFGPWGAVIGGVVGAIGTLINSLVTYKDETYAVENATSALIIMHNKASDGLLNSGVTCQEFKSKYDEMIGSITGSLVNLDEYNNRIETNSNSYKQAQTSLENLISQVTLLDGSIPYDSFDKINNYINTMVESIKSTGDAQVKATSVIIDNLLQEQKINQETAEKSIEAAKLVAEVQNDKAEQYRLSMIELENQYKNGEVTLEQYKIKQQELADQYGITKDSIDESRNKLSNFIDLINSGSINPTDYEELNGLIKNIGISYEDSTNLIKTNYTEQKNQLIETLGNIKLLKDEQATLVEQIRETSGARSIEYQEAKNLLNEYEEQYSAVALSISGLRELEKEDINSVKETTSLALLSIVSTLKKSNYDMSEDSEKTTSYLKELFKKMGIDINLDSSQSMQELTSQIDKILGTNFEETVNKSNGIFKGIGAGQELIRHYEQNGKNARDAYQRGVEYATVNIQVDADTSKAETSTNSWVQKWKDQLNFRLQFYGPIPKEDGGVYSGGTWHSISQYANGGSPSHGSIFVAGEHGAEIVGHINGKTEVLNQSQIASSIYSAMISAMSQFNGKSEQIEVHVHTDEGTVIDRVNRTTKQTGQFPFIIPTN